MTSHIVNSLDTILDSTTTADYQVHISFTPEDDAWDTFLAKAQGGHHVQTGLWAQVKGVLGWGVIRVVVTSGNKHIVGGAQIMVRRFRGLGKIGIISKGPLFSSSNPILTMLIIKELVHLAKLNHIQFLVVQPPNNGEETGRQLAHFGFNPVRMTINPTATILIDLHKDLDTIQSEIKQSTRRNIRIAQRKGITIREGTEADIGRFYVALKATSRRKNFATFPIEYYHRMWELFAPRGYARLFVAEYEGETVSSQLAISFGDTVINKMTAWSGEYSSLRPNEALYWAVIQWAKAHGFRYYDLEGINADAAQEIAETNKVPDSVRKTFTPFKVGFGGKITFFPGAYVYISNPILRTAYRIILPKVYQSPLMMKVMGHLRTS